MDADISGVMSQIAAFLANLRFADNTGAEWVWCHPLGFAWYREPAMLESLPTSLILLASLAGP
jgi:hypothetical protein